MRIKLIEELPMATSAELYQLSWVIEQLLADPRRLVQARVQVLMEQNGSRITDFRRGQFVFAKAAPASC